MAGDWIKIEHALPDKPEVIAIADTLAIDQDAVVGKLLRLWIWADQQTHKGNARSVTQSFVDRITLCQGFAEAMQIHGWLRPTKHGLIFPHFDRHNGQTAKTRGLTAKRVAKSRNGGSVTPALPEKRREEKRREETKDLGEVSPKPPRARLSDPLSVVIPEALSAPAFGNAWQRWLDYRRDDKRKPVTATQATATLAKLADLGATAAIEAINESISNGWQGLFKPKESGNGRSRQPEGTDPGRYRPNAKF